MMTTDTSWTSADHKRFEESLVSFGGEVSFGGSPFTVQLIAQFMGKDMNLVLHHYNALHQDVELIESGSIIVYYPDYYSPPPPPPVTVKTSEVSDKPKKKGKSWTVEEHRAFLWGMETCGESDWKRISRDFVRTRIPTQVASHAQKYFLRQNDTTVKKRSSIHDITSVGTSSLSTIPRSDSNSVSQPPHNHQLPPRHPYSQQYYKR